MLDVFIVNIFVTHVYFSETCLPTRSFILIKQNPLVPIDSIHVIPVFNCIILDIFLFQNSEVFVFLFLFLMFRF